MKRKEVSLHNRIWIAGILLLLLLFSFLGYRSASPQILALEQEARCGAAEHVHTSQCYDGSTLVCLKPAHVHKENCYLVLLEDNDINALLSFVDSSDSHNLETVILDTLDTALDGVSIPEPAEEAVLSVPREVDVTQLDIAGLNDTLKESGVRSVVFNENLYKASASGPTDLALPTAVDTDDPASETADSGGIALLSVGDAADGGSASANFYVYLDGAWVCIGTMDFTTYRVSGSRNRYGARVNTTTMVQFINEQLGTSLTRNDFELVYTASANPSDYSWSDAGISSTYTTFGTNYGQQVTARQAKYIRLVDEYEEPLAFYTVTYAYADGATETFYVLSGTTVALPDAEGWSDGSAEYAGGQSVQIRTTTTFTELTGDGSARIVYNVNFPTVSGVTVATEPTLYGTAATVLTDTVENGASAVIRNVSQQEVEGKVDGNTTDLSRIVRFAGWQVGDTDTILSPNSRLSYEELLAYASGTRLTLYGVWEYRAVQTASFFVRYDSVAVDTEGNITDQDSSLYTPELFATHVGGADTQTLDYEALNEKYYIADTSSDNSYGADQIIRGLYGEQAGIWFQSFPEDEAIFEMLKDYAQYLEVDGEPVDVNDLNGNTYTIRWYVMKCQSDAWHIDGRLVKKQGIFHVAKTFAGNLDSIASAKENFYIEAVNNDGGDRFILTLETAADPTAHPAYQEGTNFLSPASYDAGTDRYLWELTGVAYGESWTVTEVPNPVDAAFSTHTQYNVVDIFNLQNATGTDTTVDITGVTYATDAGTPEVLRVEFTNIYHTSDSIIIKKEDARTGSALSGASFRLMQGDTVLQFTYDTEKNRYIYDPENGTITQLSGAASGYYEIVVAGFRYDDGDVVVQELTPPTGYAPIENISLGYTEDGTVGILSQSPMASYSDGLLIVQNTTETTSVTVNKQWLCPEADQTDVTVQLLANGSLVSYLIPGVEPEKVLTADGGYNATWLNLPRYANGSEITWSVREVKIGSENCKSDYTFANWIVSYGAPVQTTDESGNVINTAFTITNDTRRTLLRLTKTNLGGATYLPGATFTLQLLTQDASGSYVADPNFVLRTQTTDSGGSLTFDNLLYGYYRLTETSPPVGYETMLDPVYLTIQESGAVLVENHTYAQAGTSAYSIVVRNRARLPLPATGGFGRELLPLLGGGMMTAIGAYASSILRKKRRERSDQ